MEHADYLIVGGGYAGATAAITLRREGARGRVVLASAEPDYPYLRYTLSKEFLLGRRDEARIHIRPPSFYQAQGVEVRLGNPVVSLDLGRRRATLSSGEEVAFERLLLATGARPRRLPLPGADLPKVYLLRSLAQAKAIRAEMAPGRRAVVVGGGFIGVEVASALALKGLQVAVVEVMPTLWGHIFGEEMGRFFQGRLEALGVRVLAPAHCAGIEAEGQALAVTTEEGHRLPCDFVVMGVGVEPEAGLARRAGLAVDRGVVVDQQLRTSAPGVFAGGDCARFYHPLFGEHIRVEHWDTAGGHGRTAALNMLGREVVYDEVPYFFSNLPGLWVEFLGHAPRWEGVAVRRFGPTRFTAFYLWEGRPVGALLVNNTEELGDTRALIKAQAPVPGPRLADTSTDLASLVRGLP